MRGHPEPAAKRWLLVAAGLLCPVALLGSGCERCAQPGSRPDQAVSPPTAGADSATPAAPTPNQPAGARAGGGGRSFKLPCEPPMLVGAGDLDGKHGVELAVACDDALLVLDSRGELLARIAAEGWPQVLLVADLTGRGQAAVLAGWGTSRRRLQAPATLVRYRLLESKLTPDELLRPQTTRNQFAALELERAGKDWSVLLAHFTSKYEVRHLRLRSDGRTEEIGSWRMAMALAPTNVLGPGGLAVGRLYGDALGQDGDAFVWIKGKRVPIPTTRGVNTLVAADLDGDGREELLLADGWAQRYAAEGRALLTRARWDGKRFTTRLLGQLAGEYTINAIQVVDVERDGKPEILVRGSGTLQLLRGQGERWRGTELARNVGDALAVDLDGDGLHEVVVVGRAPAIIRLDKVPR